MLTSDYRLPAFTPEHRPLFEAKGEAVDVDFDLPFPTTDL